jgi:hypothetical protein
MAAGTFVLVEQGTIYAATGWVQIDDVVTVGTDPVEFTQFSAAGTYTAGAGLTQIGTQFSITNTTVTPGTYGNATETVTIAVNSRGQITSISQQPAASYGNAEVSAYLAAGTDTAGYTTTGDISADNIVASGSITSLGYAQIVGDITAFGNVSVGDTLFVSGNSIINGNLILNGRTSVGAINNLTIDGGQPFDIISTDGSGGLSWIPQYSDSDVNNYLSSGANVNLITTGEIIADQASLSSILTDSISVTGGPASLGPVGNVSITGGSNGQVLTTNGSGNLSWTTVSGGSGPTYQGIASGNLTAGAPVVATDDGKLSRVIGATQGIGSAAVFNSNEPGQATVVTLTPNGYVAAFYPNRR